MVAKSLEEAWFDLGAWAATPSEFIFELCRLILPKKYIREKKLRVSQKRVTGEGWGFQTFLHGKETSCQGGLALLI